MALGSTAMEFPILKKWRFGSKAPNGGDRGSEAPLHSKISINTKVLDATSNALSAKQVQRSFRFHARARILEQAFNSTKTIANFKK